jgi:hypothetical protein
MESRYAISHRLSPLETSKRPQSLASRLYNPIASVLHCHDVIEV